MPKNINLKGTAGATYDLDELAVKGTRTSTDDELIVQIWYWNPNLPAENPHSKPNPSDLRVGQMWLSKRVEPGDPNYDKIKGE